MASVKAKSPREVAKAWEGIQPRVAEQVLAWGTTLALLDNDPDDPWITGAASAYDRGSREMAYRTMPPMSFKTPWGNLDYSRFEPFATMAATIVDTTNAIRRGGAARIPGAMWRSLIGQIKSKTFMQGMADMMEIATSGEPGKASKWLGNFTTSWVPNIIRGGARNISPTIPERGVYGKGEEWWKTLARRTAQNTEVPQLFGALPDQPKFDLWGKPARRAGVSGPITDYAFRVLLPVGIRPTPDVFFGDRLLLAWNTQHPGHEWLPVTPNRSYIAHTREGRETRYMNDEQYARFSQRAGELAKRALEATRHNWNVQTPTLKERDYIRKIITRARKAARLELRMELPAGEEE